LPIISDPSHGTGRRSLVLPMSKASVACGADGLLIETHPNPDKAISDADQTISLSAFSKLMEDIKNITKAVGREV
jgi:3-deoxy-7-phosphoheptulonate synthase